MKTLPLGLAGLGTKPVLGSEPGNNDDTHDFSAMLQSPPAERQPLPPRPRTPVAAAAPRETPRQDEGGSAAARDTAPRPRAEAHAAPRDDRGSSDRQSPDRPGPASREGARPDQARGNAVERPRGQQAKAVNNDDEQGEEKPGQTAIAAQPADAPWPPAGLGGLEAVLAASAGAPQPVASSPAATTMPGSAQAAPTTQAVGAAGTPQPALPAGIQPGTGTGIGAGPLAATPGAAAPAPGVGDFAAKMAAATIDPAPSKAGDAIVASAAGAADGTPAPAPDAATLFALHAPTGHAGAARGDATVFDGSPTPTPHLHEGFDDAVGARMSWLADQKIGHAHIKITPDDLGPVEVRLQLDGDKVSASFTAAHAEVRQALEQSLPRLREMLGQHGFQLGHTDVGGQQPQGRQAGGRGDFAAKPDAAGLDEVAGVGIPAAVLRQRGLLDAYA